MVGLRANPTVSTALPSSQRISFLMTRLKIRLFGQVSVQRDGEPLSGLSAKALELLCYLLLHRERGHTREALAGLFWPEAPDSMSKKYLRQAIWRLGSALASHPGPAQAESGQLLIVHPNWIRVNAEAAWWLDVAVFEQAYDLYRDTPGEDLTDSQAQSLEAAIALYRGDLIETWYQDWCVYERDRLQLTFLAMLDQLMSHCEACRLYPKGIAYGQCVLRYDSARESTHRHLMRLYYRAGDRTTALRQYDRCGAALAKHFNLPPSRETVALYHQIRGDRLENPARPVTFAASPDGGLGSDLLLGLQTKLDHIQASLTALRCQVQQAGIIPVSRLNGTVRDA
jgi:DNA-binding SARP family transcriptional activator